MMPGQGGRDGAESADEGSHTTCPTGGGGFIPQEAKTQGLMRDTIIHSQAACMDLCRRDGHDVAFYQRHHVGIDDQQRRPSCHSNH
jgi:hypothetical protein